MCGIVGFTGNRQAAPILLDGLSKLEYRGYDSAGLAVRDGEALAQVVKAKGRLSNLIEKTDNGNALKGTCGIGHTRWATHGEPSQTNAHPHVSGNCSRSGSGAVESEVVGVHNGIIENYTELKEKLLKHGYTFYSQTDTEVVIKLVDYYYKKYNLGPIDAIAKTMVRVRGSYALELMFRDYPGEIWVARKDSPMIIGIADGETYVASDVPAILKYTRNVYYIGNLEFAKLVPGEAHFYDLNGDEIEKQTTEIKWDAEAAEKGGFEHFMMKEIHEQPKAVQDTLNSVIKDGAIDLSSVEITEEEIKNFEQIYIIACGSAWHVGMAAQYVLEDMADVPVRVELASEFRYRKMPLDQKALVIVVSQSGETADTLAALRLAKEKGITTMAIVNVVGSSIAREADKVFYTLAGPEISVATTKAYSAQLAAMYCLAVQFAKVKGKITDEQYSYYISELLTLPEKMQKALEDKERIQWFAAKYANAHDVFFVGRGVDYIRSEKDILKLVNTIIANTKGDGEKSGEDFWVKAERLLYCALIGYIYYEAPEEEQNFSTLLEFINASEAREDDEEFKNPVDELFEDLEKAKPEHFAVRQYKKYKLAAGKTAKSILISCGARLAPFDIKELRDLMAYDEMELDMLGDQRTAMFVIISDTDDTFNFVVSILYTQLFNLLCDKADDEHGGRLPYHVRLLLDEFANIGQIPKFDKLIATIRSREISASIILQSQSQLKTIYKDAAETIIGNCDTMLFLGGKESSTLKEISETLGKETIDLYNTSDTRGNSPSFGTNYQKTGKELMSRDELAVMDGSKCILQLRGVRPFLSDKFDITKHKRYKELSDFDKKNEFDVERYLKHELRLLTTEEFDLYEVDVTEQAQE